MNTVAQRRTTRKTAQRSIGWVERPSAEYGNRGALEIVVNGEPDYYLCREIESQIGGRGFELEKADYTVYHVLLNADGSGDCTCPGHTYHGHCKHREGLAALERAGKL